MLAALALLTVLSQSPSDPSEEWAPAPVPAPAAPEPQAPAPAPKPAATVTEPPKEDVPAPDPRRFTWGHFALALMGTMGSTGYFAVRIEGGAMYGWPRRMAGTVNRAMGPSVSLAADLLAGKVAVPSICQSAGLCGSRYQGGLALRGAWSWGVIGNDGVVAPIHAVFLQAVGFLSSNSVPSAPLAPASMWGEHGVRFDLGVTSGFLRGSTWPKPGSFVIGGGLYFALSLEWLIQNTPESGRFRGGVSLGIGI